MTRKNNQCCLGGYNSVSSTNYDLQKVNAFWIHRESCVHIGNGSRDRKVSLIEVVDDLKKAKIMVTFKNIFIHYILGHVL